MDTGVSSFFIHEGTSSSSHDPGGVGIGDDGDFDDDDFDDDDFDEGWSQLGTASSSEPGGVDIGD